MEALSRREEQEIEAACKTQALKLCDDVVKDFAKCCEGRTFSIPFACGDKHKAMQACIKPHMTEEKMDAMKLDYIAHRSERGRQAVEKLWEERREKLLKMSGRKDNNPNAQVGGKSGSDGERQV